MYARSTTFRGDPSASDDGIAYTRDKVLPAVQQMDGCIGLSMLVDRHTGRCIVTSAWEDVEAMHRSAEAVRGIRETAIRTVHGVESETAVVEWAVEVLHRVRQAPPTDATPVILARGPVGPLTTASTASAPSSSPAPTTCPASAASASWSTTSWAAAPSPPPTRTGRP
jgi:quinol monooxygenase YgiN